MEAGPDLERREEPTDVHITDAGDVVFAVRREPSNAAAPLRRLSAWLPGASRYLELAVDRKNNAPPRPSACCRVADTLMVSLFGGDSAHPAGHRLDIDLATGNETFRRLPNVRPQPGALGMNRRGEVVGAYMTCVADGLAERAFHRASEPWTMTLGTFGGPKSAAFSVNVHGGIVGRADYPPKGLSKSTSAAFLSLGCKLWDLSNLIDGPTPASLGAGQLLINDRGLIAGNVDGPYAPASEAGHAFILVPVEQES